jgi:hypothetical protein
MSSRRTDDSPPPAPRPFPSSTSAPDATGSLLAAFAVELKKLGRQADTADKVRQELRSAAGDRQLGRMDSSSLLLMLSQIFDVAVEVTVRTTDGRHLHCQSCRPRGAGGRALLKVYLLQHGVPPTAWTAHEARFTIA